MGGFESEEGCFSFFSLTATDISITELRGGPAEDTTPPVKDSQPGAYLWEEKQNYGWKGKENNSLVCTVGCSQG